MTFSSRRTAIRRGIVAAIAAAELSDFTSSVLFSEALVTYPGIQLYTVDKELKDDIHGTLNTLRRIGYREVEGAGFIGLDPRLFRDALVSADLKCKSTHFFTFGESDPNILFEQANVLGVDYVVSSLIGKFSKKPAGIEMNADDYKSMAEFCNQLGYAAKAAGLQFAYHNHNVEFRNLGHDTVGYDILLKATDPELVKLELDCGWMRAAGFNPIEYFKQYPNRYRMVHIKDFTPRKAPSLSLSRDERPEGTVLGTGFIQYKPILMAAKSSGVVHFYVEQEPPFIGMTALQAAERDYQYLESILK
jgi:sugar phosphate isomerase/epimerase